MQVNVERTVEPTLRARVCVCVSITVSIVENDENDTAITAQHRTDYGPSPHNIREQQQQTHSIWLSI